MNNGYHDLVPRINDGGDVAHDTIIFGTVDTAGMWTVNTPSGRAPE